MPTGFDASPDSPRVPAIGYGTAAGTQSHDFAFGALQDECTAADTPLWQALRVAGRRDERSCVAALRHEKALQDAGIDRMASERAIHTLAQRLVGALRERQQRGFGVDALMQEYCLSCDEGVALMCLAEALLRIPDRATADRLIADKIGGNDWQRHLGASPALFVNAATWALLITGKLVAPRSASGLGSLLTGLLAKGGAPLIRRAVDLAMRMLGNQFVIGQTIEAALENSRACMARGYRYSYDMLGEAALTADDAAAYTAAYADAIGTIGRAAQGSGIRDRPGISVKLSALHPRYGRAQRARVMAELLPRLKGLVLLARAHAVGINIDAEEADRLTLSLQLLEALALDADLAGFDGIGFVVQAYQKRSLQVIDFLADLARRSGHRLMVRLVKGAYWDTEIKRAQVDGMTDYPVYTRKVHTDMSYLVCAGRLLADADLLYPQFATHNAQTVAAVHARARQAGVSDFEFQGLHGMGEALYDQVLADAALDARCRIYAPVGPHRTLLAYLVRRLLENGANSSFVNRLADPGVPIAALVVDPFASPPDDDGAHPAIVLPDALFGARRNSRGTDLNDDAVLAPLAQQLAAFGGWLWHAAPLRDGCRDAVADRPGGDDGPAAGATGCGRTGLTGPKSTIRNPACHDDLVGTVVQADAADVDAALTAAAQAMTSWKATPARRRARILEHAADLFQASQVELMALLVREAGKTLPNACSEIREAIDFLRFYASESIAAGDATALGIIVCISPWNFPLAIFTGQVGAALAAGNVVLAKPAEQTPLVAYRAVQLLHQAGVPRAALQLLPGPGAIAARALADRRVHGVLFTGSTGVAQSINRTLARRAAQEAFEPVLIAETGGQNAMIVDASALPEQVVQDVLASAFDSAGQRCSALRVLCLQEEVADDILRMLRGAMAELCVGRPDRLCVDIGPVIDAAARERLHAHISAMREAGAGVFEMPAADDERAILAKGSFVLPTLLEISDLTQLHGEVFGPVLHVLRYRHAGLPALIEAINGTGYGLTLGVHSRIDATVDVICATARAGNIYVNRNMIGAVVGSQPFGGAGLSGTGPKAGGALYLRCLQRQSENAGNPAGCVAANLPALPVAPFLAGWLAWRAVEAKQSQDAAAPAIPAPLATRVPGPDIALPGPTGEGNVWSFRPRGNVLCIAGSTGMLLQQLDAVFGSGNRAVIPVAQALLLPADLPAAARAGMLFHDGRDETDDGVRLDAALTDHSLKNAWSERLAARNGALVARIVTRAGSAIDLTRLISECTISTNLTASGGNARLMSLEALHHAKSPPESTVAIGTAPAVNPGKHFQES